MFAPAGFGWLLAREARLLWRGSLLVRSRHYVLVPVLLVGIGFQGAALVLASVIARHSLPMPELILVANLNLFFFGFLMLSRAITAAVDVLYGRGDVDFLLASPIPPGRVLAVRMLGVAASVAAPWLLLGGVLANALAVFGQVWALAIYPMLLAVGLLAAAGAFALVVVLVDWTGPARARALGQFMALATGLAIFALGQAPRLIEPARMSALWRRLMPDGAGAGLRWIPGRAMLGQPAPLLTCMAFALAVFVLAWFSLDRKFASGAISAGAHRPGGTARRQTGRFRRSPFAATFAKSSRLLARFPGLLTQTIYRSLTLVPVAIILAGGTEIGTGRQVVAPLLVFLTGQLASFFISVIVGAEQAPELAASAPVTPLISKRAGLAAAAYGTMLIMALPTAAVAWREAAMLPVLLGGMAGVLASNLALGYSVPIPLIRAGFGKSQKATMLGLVLGVAVSSLWALAVWLIVTPHFLADLLSVS